MKNKVLHLFLIAVFCLAVQNVAKSVSVAADKVKNQGMVVSVNADTGELVYTPKGETKPVKVMAEDKKMLKGVEKGMTVMVQYTPGDTNMADRIKIIPERREAPSCGG